MGCRAFSLPGSWRSCFWRRGRSNRQIAASARLTEATIKRHLANIYQNMGVSSRTEASREALLREWITIEEVTQSDPPVT